MKVKQILTALAAIVISAAVLVGARFVVSSFVGCLCQRKTIDGWGYGI